MPHLSSPARGKAHLSTQPGPDCGMVSEVLSPGLSEPEVRTPSRDSCPSLCAPCSLHLCPDLSLGALAAFPVPDQTSPRALVDPPHSPEARRAPSTHSRAYAPGSRSHICYPTAHCLSALRAPILQALASSLMLSPGPELFQPQTMVSIPY